MSTPPELRIQGIYQQRQEGYFMQRVKLAAGVITADQALHVCAIADRFSGGEVHLTTRGSMELHWLRMEDLPEVARFLAEAGLTSRGACGGAVRGVTCSTHGHAGFPVARRLAQRLHSHFTNNPSFEGLPKKFKIAVEAGSAGARHLIQDVGIVLAGTDGETGRFDVWTGGGLGRAPAPGFLLAREVSEERVVPIVEGIVRIYAAHTPPGKRLKHLLAEIGRDRFRDLLEAETGWSMPELFPDTGSESGVSASGACRRLEARPFAGEIATANLRKVAECARRFAGGVMMLTVDQNIALHLVDEANETEAREALAAAGFPGTSREERVTFRICPGSHECRMGLGPTRDIARAILERLEPGVEHLAWAISGCHNSCSQPQLAGMGVVISRLAHGEDGERLPRFDILRSRSGEPFAVVAEENLTLDELLQAVGRRP